jgi:glycosyltransferase involved in cell wall biosynthesis
MRIALMSHSAELLGAEKSMVELAEDLVKQRHHVEVYLPTDGPLRGVLVAAGVAPENIRRSPAHRWMSRRGHSPAGLVRLVQCICDVPGVVSALRERRPDVLVVNTSVAPAPMIAGKLLGLPTVILVCEAVRTNPTLGSALPKAVVVAAMRAWSDLIIANSDYTGKQAGAGHVVYPFVSIEFAPREPKPIGPLRAVILGSIGGDKGQVDAVSAVDISIAAGVDVRLDIYGGGVPAEVEILKERIASTGLGDRITYHGQVEGVADVLSHADVLLMASRNEGFGRVTVEALEAGVPVIGYDAGATTEILRRGGGILIKPDPVTMASAITDLATKPEILARYGAEAAEAGAWWLTSSTQSLVDLIEQVAMSSGCADVPIKSSKNGD